jgi:hypothetical protein
MQHIQQHSIEENRVSSPDCRHTLSACSRPQTQHRYAWLEHEDGMWHFLTSLFADPSESTRRWSDQQCALDELINEGWTIIRPYPEPLSANRNSESCLCGYGLVRTIH